MAAQFEIHSANRASVSSAFALICEGFNELVQEGMLDDCGGFGIAPDDRAIWVSLESEVVSVLTFQYDDLRNCFVVTLGYTEPSSRRRGLFTQLLQRLMRVAREEGLRFVDFDVATNNSKTLQLMGKLEATEMSRRFSVFV